MSVLRILRLAVPTPLSKLFDYYPPTDVDIADCHPGQRFQVSFGRSKKRAVLIQLAAESELPANKIKNADKQLDIKPVLSAELVRLARWTSRYYQHPIGEVVQLMLPLALRSGEVLQSRGESVWSLSDTGKEADLKRAPKQQQIVTALQSQPLSAGELNQRLQSWRTPMKLLREKGWVLETELPCLTVSQNAGKEQAKEANAEQQTAIDAVANTLGHFVPFLLEGITGSGKTEVYLQLIEKVLQREQQVLLLLPEISLTPQIVSRFERRFAVPIAVMHSGLNERQRLCAWQMSTTGEAKIVIGTRSAVFAPLKQLGLIVVDEEHDGSFKQQEGCRYHARDLAVVRASQTKVPILLGSATPSLESLHNALSGHYRHLFLKQRAADARSPRIRMLDLRAQKPQEGLAAGMLHEMEKHLDNRGQVLLFLNRRGFAPVLFCQACGWMADCPRCDAHTTVHHRSGRLRCHHCGYERPKPQRCGQCGEDQLVALGQGTERIEQVLLARFPKHRVVRIDRDSTRRKGELEQKLASVKKGEADILIGTQMLAKGHHFPNVTLVGLLDIDQGLFSADFRAQEQLAQLLVQVAGRSGRGEKAGEVLIQTHQPDHPLLLQLIKEGYAAVAKTLLAERRLVGFPPFARLAMVRAEAVAETQALDFLQQVADELQTWPFEHVQLLGPVPAPMERRLGR
ncbi:MAG: primosomal protein N', partial [Gammaproteobacteria bacterium]|nr:primosomal protein N' [Gammaproteobacteria bacterium]